MIPAGEQEQRNADEHQREWTQNGLRPDHAGDGERKGDEDQDSKGGEHGSRGTESLPNHFLA